MRALSTLLLMTISFFQAQGQSAADLAGTWNGKLNFPGQSLRLVIHLNEQEDGSWTGTLDSPDQQATGIVADEVRVNGDSLAFRIQRLRASFQGLYQDGKIEGTFEQAGMKLPLSLARKAIEGPRRPQTPAAPFPYQSEEVRFRSMDTLGLAGTLTIPAGEGPFPAVILITGSGPQDRDETIAGHKPFWVIADYLTRQGIAVLRYDERGVGKSDGDFSSATSYDFSVDAEAAMEAIRADIKSGAFSVPQDFSEPT